MSKILSLANLHELDNGKPVAAVNHALRQAVMDVIDRPGDKALRKVTIQFLMRPTLERETAALDTVSTQIRVRTSIPDRLTIPYEMLPEKDGRLQFSEFSPQDPRQTGFQFVNQQTGEVVGGPNRGDEDDDAPDVANLE